MKQSRLLPRQDSGLLRYARNDGEFGTDAGLSQLEQRLQKFHHCFSRGLGRGGIAADMWIELDAGVLVGEGRVGIAVHQHAAVAVPDVAIAHGLG